LLIKRKHQQEDESIHKQTQSTNQSESKVSQAQETVDPNLPIESTTISQSKMAALHVESSNRAAMEVG
jgi:hypothetical protein